jgi:hypothetical protein
MAGIQETIAHCAGLLDRQRGLDMALCWTVVEPLGRPAVSVEGVVERLGGDPAAAAVAVAEGPVGADFEEDARRT